MNGEIHHQPNHLAGSIDESERKFTAEERAVAEMLVREGKHIKALAETGRTGRFADALVSEYPISDDTSGTLVEFKRLRPGASSVTVRNVVNNSIRRGGQARHMIFYAVGSGLVEPEALVGLARAKGIARGRLDSVRIIGDGYDVVFAEFD